MNKEIGARYFSWVLNRVDERHARGLMILGADFKSPKQYLISNELENRCQVSLTFHIFQRVMNKEIGAKYFSWVLNKVDERHARGLMILGADFKSPKQYLISNDPDTKRFSNVLACPWTKAIDRILNNE